MTLNIMWKDKNCDIEIQNSQFPLEPSNFKPTLVVGGLLKLRYRTNRSQIRKEDGRIDFHSENQQNH